eukprot:TRINITY_DN81968_c0_g1_i1.p1 TRINITY_DN81968_c0_g1~~TRINITY_DN81968_c0_g1_i1.p1  ORF type:complete len:114 (+),score=19.80 TRINITY_DN81968_c0_g1_i1:51-392(+)
MQNKKASFENMNTLSSLTETAFNKGYTDNFRMEEDGLYAPATDIHYLPNEVKIDNFYRFEGASDPDDNAILYCIETHDGVKGTLIDAYGANSEELINNFIKEVEEIQKAEATK